MAEFHGVPLIPHDMPPLVPIKAKVSKDKHSGRWVWEHPCRVRGPERPFHSHPAACWAEALQQASYHVGWCP